MVMKMKPVKYKPSLKCRSPQTGSNAAGVGNRSVNTRVSTFAATSTVRGYRNADKLNSTLQPLSETEERLGDRTQTLKE